MQSAADNADGFAGVGPMGVSINRCSRENRVTIKIIGVNG